jgi:ABC-type branched-subunit amino acid transport system ATPase component
VAARVRAQSAQLVAVPARAGAGASASCFSAVAAPGGPSFAPPARLLALLGLFSAPNPRHPIPALLPPPGAGKSSVVAALMRLTPISAGNISVFGADATMLPLPALRRLFAVVPQAPLLFSGSLRDNLDPLGAYKGDDAELAMALEVGAPRSAVSAPPSHRTFLKGAATAASSARAVETVPSVCARRLQPQPAGALTRPALCLARRPPPLQSVQMWEPLCRMALYRGTIGTAGFLASRRAGGLMERMLSKRAERAAGGGLSSAEASSAEASPLAASPERPAAGRSAGGARVPRGGLSPTRGMAMPERPAERVLAMAVGRARGARGVKNAARQRGSVAARQRRLWLQPCHARDLPRDLTHPPPRRPPLPPQFGGEHGLQLSTGQQQLLCLARALLRRARLVLLDECTSSVDPPTAALMASVLSQQLGGRGAAVIQIAHDLRAILEYDRVMLMERGRVVEDGPPADLSADAGSRFAQLLARAGRLSYVPG